MSFLVLSILCAAIFGPVCSGVNVYEALLVCFNTNSGFRCEMMWSITGDYQYQERILLWIQEEFEDTKGAIRIRISKKNRQHNGQKKKHKWSITDIYQYKVFLWTHVKDHWYLWIQSYLFLQAYLSLLIVPHLQHKWHKRRISVPFSIMKIKTLAIILSHECKYS